MATALRIGLSARLLYPEASRGELPTKTLHYAEEHAPNWLMARGAAVLMIPRMSEAAASSPDAISPADYANALDGLVLQGGSDVAPLTYGEHPLRPEWSGDPVRDDYELALLREFLRQRKPILGICRGCQLINVALEGTLYQDLATQLPGSGHHRHPTRYERNYHDALLLRDTRLAALYGGARRVRLNSVHHQAIKSLGRGLIVQARSEPDHLIEAIRLTGPGYVVGVQWHPEFIPADDIQLLDGAPIAAEFLAACEQARADGSPAALPCGTPPYFVD